MRPRLVLQIVAFVVVTLTYSYVQLYTDFKLSKEFVRFTGFTANDTLAGVDNTVVVSKRDVSNASRALKEPSVPSTPSRNLCEEVVHLSSDHRQVVELLTRAQFPSALKPAGSESPMSPLQRSDVQFACAAGKALDKPKVILDVFLFGGGEVDTLEIRLYELYPVVDAFIAVTSNVTHKGEAAFDALEPLLKTARFEKFRNKVEIFKHEQTGTAAPNGINFKFEVEKENAIARELAKRYDNTTLVIFGHVDEIPAREDVWKVAHCETTLPGNFGIWFPFGNLDFAFRSDFPARNIPWTLGDPGVTVANHLDQMRLPRGRMQHVLGRGFHATNYCFPPQIILKMMTATEYKGFDDLIDEMKDDERLSRTCTEKMQELRQKCLHKAETAYATRTKRIFDLVREGENAELFYIPHAMRLDNMTRYPSWDPSGRADDWRASALPNIL